MTIMAMTFLYITADSIGTSTGGGVVTFNESEAMKELAAEHNKNKNAFKDDCKCEVWGRTKPGEMLECDGEEPWGWDACARSAVIGGKYKLAHFYAGTFSDTVKFLRETGCKVTFTAAAHDVDVSRQEHERYWLAYNYPHLTDPGLWQRYLQGYKDADVLICPSMHSANVMRKFGCMNKIAVIPHGVNVPDESKIKPPPARFVLGYLGSCGAPDKGVIYLLQAWKRLNYRDGSMLILAGRDSTSPFVQHLVAQYGGGSIYLAGWQENVGDFYNRLSAYVQPSSTEGFGCEVLESLAYGRPVICSDGAGAADVARDAAYVDVVPACNVEVLAKAIDEAKLELADTNFASMVSLDCRGVAEAYSWKNIRQRYVKLWKELLNGT